MLAYINSIISIAGDMIYSICQRSCTETVGDQDGHNVMWNPIDGGSRKESGQDKRHGP